VQCSDSIEIKPGKLTSQPSVKNYLHFQSINNKQSIRTNKLTTINNNQLATEHVKR